MEDAYKMQRRSMGCFNPPELVQRFKWVCPGRTPINEHCAAGVQTVPTCADAEASFKLLACFVAARMRRGRLG